MTVPDLSGEERSRVDAAVAVLTSRLGAIPPVAVVLGSGLGAFASRVVNPVVVPYSALPHWPRPAVAGHAGQIVAGTIGGRPVVLLSGRVHLYEGHELSTVVFATRVLARAGVTSLVLTNAAGGINPRLGRGTLMVIDDHINLMGGNPLVGPNDPEFGRRFPDMSQVYSRRLRAIADEAALSRGMVVEHGVYVGVLGPSYETPAEIRAFRALGGDAVGMSTVPEALAARHMGMEVLGISCISNPAAGLTDEPLSEEDVLASTARAQGAFSNLLEGILVRL